MKKRVQRQTAHHRRPQACLPPLPAIQKVLQHARETKQRFFVDEPISDQDEVINACSRLYAGTKQGSVWDWITINIGLYYIFLGVQRQHNELVLGMTASAVSSYIAILTIRLEPDTQNLRLDANPSLDSCRGLALLVGYNVDNGSQF